MAQKQAAKHKSMVTKDDDDDEGTMSKPKIVTEDLGGAPADLDEEDHPEDGTVAKHALQMTRPIIERVLSRTVERDAADQVGRPKDMHTYMQRIERIERAHIAHIERAHRAHRAHRASA